MKKPIKKEAPKKEVSGKASAGQFSCTTGRGVSDESTVN